jgi:hypothetical protein
MRRAWMLATLLAAIGSAAAATSEAAGPGSRTTPVATRGLSERLQRHGRADARLTQTVVAAGETLRSDRGRLALEPPDRLRLDFTSGERVTLRGDGGEWLQPQLEQLLVFRPEQSQTVVGLWRAFLGGGGSAYGERALGSRRYRLVAREPAAGEPDSLEVTLGRDGLPARVEAWAGDQRWVLALRGWAFARPRGAEAFRLRAPAGYSVFEWP